MSVVDWVERVELTFELVILLQLIESALDIYQQLSNNEKADVGLTQAALYKAFVMDPCTVYRRFTTWTLMAGETVDVFFVALKKLAFFVFFFCFFFLFFLRIT